MKNKNGPYKVFLKPNVGAVITKRELTLRKFIIINKNTSKIRTPNLNLIDNFDGHENIFFVFSTHFLLKIKKYKNINIEDNKIYLLK